MIKADTHDDTIRRPVFQAERRVPRGVIVLAFIVVAGVSFVAGIASSGAFNSRIAEFIGGNKLDLSSVQETYLALSRHFDGELDVNVLIEGANKGLVEAAGDQYTVFMNRDEATAFDDSLTGNIGGGIGVEVGMRHDAPTILRVLQGNPAEKAGVQINDVILAVNDESVEGKDVTDVTSRIRGEVDTTVKLTVSRGGVEKTFNITRARVNNPSAYGDIKDGVGVLTISRFDDDTGSLSRAVASQFKSKGVKGVVLDLRGNGGGYVTAAQAVAGIWLDKKVITTERRGGVVSEELKSTGIPILSGVPTVILVNGSSASASEIVAGALRDHGVATLIGETTFGKGTVQKLVNLSNDSLLKVTIARWYTPNGINISEKGITPDTTIVRSAEDSNAGRDPQLEAALKLF